MFFGAKSCYVQESYSKYCGLQSNGRRNRLCCCSGEPVGEPDSMTFRRGYAITTLWFILFSAGLSIEPHLAPVRDRVRILETHPEEFLDL
jgi:hypothetical protein